ncbi:MAG: purine-binding chemotaxis protein CheW, partial [Alcanivoracaceae bacterium]|nr:purine-binding chemotaxis protein CheW [Alcanivoracaceae bacterium]
MAKNSVKPFELLTEYERLSLKHSADIQKTEIKDQWSGVGFKVDEINYVLAIDKIIEVLILTETTKIPGVLQWVLGLVNIRGNLIPIIDLKSFLFNKPTKITGHTRMVVIQQVGGHVGLVVDEVFGQKHFTEKQIFDQSNLSMKGPLKYTKIAYKEDDRVWNVLEDDKL